MVVIVTWRIKLHTFAHSNCWSQYLHCIVVPLPSSPWLPVTSMAKNLPNLSSEQSWNKETIHRCQRQNRQNCEANKNSPDMFDILDLEAPCDTPWSFKINGINPGCFRYVGSRILIRPIWRPWMIIIESSLNHHAHVMHMSCTCHAHVMHMSCTCHAHVMHMSCTCHAHVMHTSCTCHAHVMHMSCTCHAHVMHMSCTCHAHVMHMSCTCHAHVMRMSCTCHAHVMRMSCACHAHVMHMSCTCHAHVMHMSCTCHAHVMHMSCTCHAHVMHMSCTCHANVMRMSCACHAHVIHLSCTCHAHVMHFILVQIGSSTNCSDQAAYTQTWTNRLPTLGDTGPEALLQNVRRTVLVTNEKKGSYVEFQCQRVASWFFGRDSEQGPRVLESLFDALPEPVSHSFACYMVWV